MGASWRGATRDFGTADRRIVSSLLGQFTRLLNVLLASLLLSLCAAPAFAQVYANDPPHPMTTDQNGVDLMTATPSYKSGTVSIGPANGGLSFTRTWRGSGAGWTDITQTGIDVNWKELGLALMTSPATVSVGMATDEFPPPPSASWYSICSAISLNSILGTGGTLTYNCTTKLWTYTARDGTIYTINTAITSYEEFLAQPRANIFGSLVSIQKPDGESVSYNYDSLNRVSSITNNRGYQLKLFYYANSNTQTGWRLITQVIGVNNAVDYCSPTALACAGFNGNVGPSGTAWPSLTWAYSSPANNQAGPVSETDALGNITTYVGGSGGASDAGAGIQATAPTGLVTSIVDNHQYVPDTNATVNVGGGGAVVTVNGQTWQYNYTCDTSTYTSQGTSGGYYCSAAHMTRTNPVGNTYTFSTILMSCWPTTCHIYASGGPNVEIISSPYVPNQVTDELGHVTNYSTDDLGRLYYVRHPEGNYTTFIYDGSDATTRGNLITSTNYPKPGSSLGNIVYSAVYPSTCTNPFTCNKPTSTTDALNSTISYTYDPATGFTLTKTSPAGANGIQPVEGYSYQQIATYAKNSSGSLMQAGSIWEPVQEAHCNNTAASVSVSGLTTTLSCAGGSSDLELTNSSYSGNNNGLATSTTASAGSNSWNLNLTTSYSYSAVGDVLADVDPRGNETAYSYDLLRRKTGEGHLTGTGYPYLALTGYNYDGDSHLILEWRVSGFNSNNTGTGSENTAYTYTPTGKVASKTDPLNDITKYTYDSLDRLSTVTDPTGYITQYQYDAASQKLQEQRAVGTPLQQNYATFTYSQNGKVLSEADARGNAITYAYDGFDRLAVTTYADGTTEKNQYDPMSAVTIWTNRGGFSLVRCYDALGRKVSERGLTGATNSGACPTGGTPNLNSRWWDQQNTSFAYDLTGKMVSASNSGWGESFAYDNAERLASHSDGLGATSYQYDAAGNPVVINHPDGVQETFAYDPLNRMTSANLNGAAVATLSYDALGRRTSVVFGDQSSQTYGYDTADRLTSLSHAFPNTPASNVSFTFGYDAASRLTSRASTNAGYEDVAPALSSSYAAANTLNQYPSVGGAGYTYWAEGPLSTDGRLAYLYMENGAFRYAYSLANGANVVSLTFSPLGHPAARQTNTPGGTDVLWYTGSDGAHAETAFDLIYTAPDPATSWTALGWRDYVLGSNPDERLAFRDTNGTVYYPHTDRQGTTIALSTGGQSLLTRTYGAYGEPRQSLAAAPGASSYPWLYTGQLYDPFLQAYDYKARIYSPSLGRFIQPDPIGTKDDIDLYTYADNSPLDGSDPGGAACIPIATSFSVYCHRAAMYAAFDRQVSSSTRFYGAASLTMAMFADTALPFAPGGASRGFLLGLSSDLEKMNVANERAIVSGTLGGPNLDARLVHQEQSMVQDHLNAYAKADPAGYAAMLKQVNGILNAHGLTAAIAGLTDELYQNTLSAVRGQLGRDIDFGNQADREKIGNALIGDLKANGACDAPTGSILRKC